MSLRRGRTDVDIQIHGSFTFAQTYVLVYIYIYVCLYEYVYEEYYLLVLVFAASAVHHFEVCEWKDAPYCTLADNFDERAVAAAAYSNAGFSSRSISKAKQPLLGTLSSLSARVRRTVAVAVAVVFVVV